MAQQLHDEDEAGDEVNGVHDDGREHRPEPEGLKQDVPAADDEDRDEAEQQRTRVPRRRSHGEGDFAPVYWPSMIAIFRQVIELLFTAYLLPALLLPLLWLVAAFRHTTFAVVDPCRALRRLSLAWASTALFFALGWTLAALGAPIEAGGRILTITAWLVFVALHLLFAGLAATITSNYASIPDGASKDSVFVWFLAVVVLQPLATAAGLSVLYRLLRLVYHQNMPGLDLIPSGV